MIAENLRILIIDDCPEDRETLRRWLQTERCSLDEASTAEEANACLASGRFDCVLLDYNLPDTEGLELLDELVHAGALAPLAIIVLTGAGNEAVAVDAMKRGADDYLVKDGTRSQDLMRAVRGAIDRAGLRHRLAAERRALTRSYAALRESEARYRAIGESIPYGVWAWNARGGAEYISRIFLDLVGRSMEECRGLGWTACLAPDEAAEVVQAWRECVRSGAEWRRELRLRGVDGVWRTVLSRAVPMHDGDGCITSWVGMNIDISDRTRAEEALRDEARRKDEFLALLAHELRNPLATVRTGLELLRRGEARPESGAALERMERQTRNLARLVDDLLDVSRITRGKLELRRVRVDLAAIVVHAADAAGPVLQAQGISWSLEVPEEPVPVLGDAVRLDQILANLIGNAAKFTPAGGHVTIACEREEATARVRVRDTGMGIDASLMARMFEPFVQGTGELARGSAGLGIGLTLVRSLAALHEGSVEAQSDGPGHGSEFELVLPLCSCAEAAEAAPGELERPAAPARQLRVAVVDDCRDAAEMLAALLEIQGHVVRTAFDGAGAVEAAASWRPDVMLLDISMPDMHGYEVAARIDERGLVPPLLVAVTGYGQPEDRQRALAAGFHAHLVKPVEPDVLTNLLATVLEKAT